jgi:K(+)-stimulated pyrophosphate-energized sodium pump
MGLMGGAYYVSLYIPAGSDRRIMLAPAVFAFGLVAFGFLGMGPVTIAVDSYGPVTDNAQSVYELSLIETVPGIKDDIKKDFGFAGLRQGQALPRGERRRRQHVQGHRQAGAHRHRGRGRHHHDLLDHHGAHQQAHRPLACMNLLSIMHAPFMLGLIAGGAVIYWFTGASTQAVSTGAYRAVEFIKGNIKLDSGATKASVEDSKKVVEICTVYAQKGMFNLFMTVFFITLAFACFDVFFFVGYLISIAIFGLYQALFMANAGGAWDNAKKLVEVELKQKGTPLHAAAVVGDTVGDPFKDTSSVAMNPIIKFTTLFGLLAAELALNIKDKNLTLGMSIGLFVLSMFFVHRSFYGMRIGGGADQDAQKKSEPAEA